MAHSFSTTREGDEMNTKTRMLTGALLAGIFAAGVHISLASGADSAPPPEDSAATLKLNNSIATCNKAEDDRFQAQQVQFERERQQNQRILAQFQTQNDSMHKQYDDLRANYAL